MPLASGNTECRPPVNTGNFLSHLLIDSPLRGLESWGHWEEELNTILISDAPIGGLEPRSRGSWQEEEPNMLPGDVWSHEHLRRNR